MRGLWILVVLIITLVVVADVANATGTKPKPKRCLEGCGFGAICKNGKCECRSRREGNPDFACITPKFYYYCQIASDPMLTTTDKQEAGIKMPASLALTQMTTRRFGKGRGTCTFALDAWSERFDGKYFIQALQFKLYQTRPGTTGIANKIRIISKVVNNNYYWVVSEWKATGWVKLAEFTSKSRKSFVKTCDKCAIRFQKLKSNFLYVNIMCCTIRFAIRPYNPAKPDMIPGVWMMTRKWSKLNSLPDGLCNNGTNAPSIDTLKAEYGFSSRTQYTTFTGLAYGNPVTYPNAFPDLHSLQDTLRACSKTAAGKLMTQAEFLFNFAKLIECEKDRIMNITFNVVKGFCNDDSAACSAAINAMKSDCPNVKPNKQMKRFLHNGCV